MADTQISELVVPNAGTMTVKEEDIKTAFFPLTKVQDEKLNETLTSHGVAPLEPPTYSIRIHHPDDAGSDFFGTGKVTGDPEVGMTFESDGASISLVTNGQKLADPDPKVEIHLWREKMNPTQEPPFMKIVKG